MCVCVCVCVENGFRERVCVCVCVNGFIESSLFAGLFDRGFFFFPLSYQGDSFKSSSAPITNRPPQ